MIHRCPWVDLNKPDYIAYHDQEWGIPVHDDQTLFEFIVLESAQAGLSWYTVLQKRENYRKAFDGFIPAAVASYTDNKIDMLLDNPGIIRNRGKIQAAITNAQCFIAIQSEYGSFASYIWQFVNHKPIVNRLTDSASYPASSPLSEQISADMKRRGFRFFGPTICYAFMQSVGMINDHSIDCFRRQPVIESYANLPHSHSVVAGPATP